MKHGVTIPLWCVALETHLLGDSQCGLHYWRMSFDHLNKVGTNIKIYGPGKVNGRGAVTWEPERRPRYFYELNFSKEKYWMVETDGSSMCQNWKPGWEDCKFSILSYIYVLKPKLYFNKTLVIILLQEQKMLTIYTISSCFSILLPSRVLSK